MIDRRTFTLSALGALGTALLPASSIQAAAAPSLHGVARRGGRYFGAAMRIDQLTAEPGLRSEAVRQCGSMTPEIHLKWNSIENRRGQFWFEPVDQLLALAGRSGIDVYGHALLWEQGTPGWALSEISNRRDWGFVDSYIEKVVSRYRNRITYWDVVNEPIDTQGGQGGLRRNTFHRAFGPDYIPLALQAARRASPRAKLILNDYSLEYDNPVEADRRRAFLRLLETMRRIDAPLDGVGVQAHLDLGKGPLRRATIAPFLQAIADMGLEIHITELDVKERDYRASPAERDQRVADEVARYLDIALDQRAVRGVTAWGLSDRHSWLKVESGDRVDRGRFGNPAPNRGLPYDAAMNPKQMHTVLAGRLGGGLS